MRKTAVLEQVKEIEAAELALTVFNAQRALAEKDKALSVTAAGGCQLLMDANSPTSIYYNRVKGFGSADVSQLDYILSLYRNKGLQPSFDLTPGALNDQVAGALADQGYIPAEQLVFMSRPVGPAVETESNGALRIKRVSEADAADYVRLIMASNGGMDLSEAVIERKAAYFCREDFINFRVYCDGQVAGLGSLFISGDKGYIANDFTFEAFRGRGCQTALIKHRLEVAKEMGLTEVYTDVEFGSASHDNMLRLGFETVFINTFFIKRT